jgi:hypothetical protein
MHTASVSLGANSPRTTGTGSLRSRGPLAGRDGTATFTPCPVCWPALCADGLYCERRWPVWPLRLSRRLSWQRIRGRGTGPTRSAISSNGLPAPQSLSSRPRHRSGGGTPRNTRSSTVRCSAPGSPTHGSTTAKRSGPTCWPPPPPRRSASTAAAPRSPSTALKHINSLRSVTSSRRAYRRGLRAARHPRRDHHRQQRAGGATPDTP